MSNERPPTLDPIAAARWASLPVESSPWLHEEVGRRMSERLDWIRAKPQTWLDWEPLRGGLDAHERVRRRYPDATRYVIETSPQHRQAIGRVFKKPFWDIRQWRAAEPRYQLPEDGQVNMVWANMGLHMAADPLQWLLQWQRLLAVDGFLMFSCLGPDTLNELRGLYVALGWPAPAHVFTDMHDWGDMLVQCGFAEPVMDMEHITLTYETPQRLLSDLNSLGRNLHLARFAGLRTPAWRRHFEIKISNNLCLSGDLSGRLALTFEVIYGHAFKPSPRFHLSERSTVSLEDMRVILKSGRVSGV